MRHQGGQFVETYSNSLLALISSAKDIRRVAAGQAVNLMVADVGIKGNRR